LIRIASAVAFLLGAAPANAQQSAPAVDPSQYSALRWRLIGPYRAGRVSAVAGIPGDPTTYYMGTPGGGIWKTTNAGVVWKPIFDDAHVASIGDIAVAPSNSNIVIAGTGEQTDGNGVYRSTDAGVSWTNIGLTDSKYISTVLIDPKNPDVILVGVLGHPILGMGLPNSTRGVYKTTNGGKTWTHTLYRDDLAGVSNMAADPSNPRILYAGMWKPFDFRAGPPEKETQSSWIYKSVDEGSSWTQVGEAGLPSDPRDRLGLAVAPGTKGQRVFAIMSQGLFRTDDGGANWRQITRDPRISGNLYICRVYVDPNNIDTVYVMQTAMYKSTDGGASFVAYKGAPGGDDYHVLWIDPQNSSRLFLGVDQGATISVDAGKTWSSWYNQPTGQFYHVITDHQFPYFSYAPQQDSGSVAIPNRSDWGEISFRDWFSAGGFEFCYIAPDPANPNIVYSGGWYGSVLRFDRTNAQIVHVFIRGLQDRMSQMPPLVFSPEDPHTLYLGAQYVLKTTNGGVNWTPISPDLTTTPAPAAAAPTGQSHSGSLPAPARAPVERPASGRYPVAEVEDADFDEREAGGKDDFELFQRPRRSSLTALAPSPVTAEVLWSGSSNGIIQTTADGSKTWQNVTPADLPKDSEVEIIEASHFDAGAAYLTIEARQDSTPYVYRTRDSGKSWQKITDGLEPGWAARVVREDPVRRGLLYAGTANRLYVSFDDGDHWQSLQLNFPASDVRDLALHGDDLVAATYGRALWILDDVAPLRQAGGDFTSASAYLLEPATAIRVRYDNDQETPLPPEEPTAKNPPDGAIIDYYLTRVPKGELTLEIHDARGGLVRRFTSAAPPEDTTPKNVPDYWFGPQAQLSKNAGLNRFVWDLRYPPPDALNFSYYGGMLDYIEYTLSDHALPFDTPREQTLGPLVAPGKYELVLIGADTLMKQTLSVVPDPRVHISQADFESQLLAGKRIDAGLASSASAWRSLENLHNAIANRLESLGVKPEDKTKAAFGQDFAAGKGAGSVAAAAEAPPAAAIQALHELAEKTASIQQGTPAAPGAGPVNRDLARIMFFVGSGDAAPSEQARAALDEACSAMSKNLAAMRDLDTQSIPAVNEILAKHALAALPVVAPGSVGIMSAPLSDACQPQ
jgi:photosystem II stability/assembly factor-like uncharacterized protein